LFKKRIDSAADPWGNRVVSGSSPWMATAESLDPQPTPVNEPVGLESVGAIFRACRLEAASATGPRQRRKQRGEGQLVGAEQKPRDTHSEARIEARFARSNHSRSSAGSVAETAFRRAIRTSHVPCFTWGRFRRTTSRNLLRTRLRSTAPPTRRDVMKPTRVPSARESTPRTNSLPG